MSRKKFFFALLGGLFSLLLTSCKCTQEQMGGLVIINDTPAEGTLISSLLPSFSWHSDSCDPSYYAVSVNENGSSLYSEYDQTSDNDTSFDWVAPPLEPGKEYAWHVRPFLIDPGYMAGHNSEETIFYTGPVCSGETLVAPELQIPAAPYWVNHSGPQEFNWAYPGSCLPEYYDYQFASDPGFTDIILSGTTTELYTQHMYQAFPNCSSIFWRVAANDGSTVGPWSDAKQFHWVTDETCWQNHYISDDAARINVLLYQDRCDQTGFASSSSTVLNPGCALNEENNRIYADGQQNAGDWNVWNYTVDLGAGPCPSTGLDQMTFDYFAAQEYFHVLAPGTYCVSISKNQIPTQNGPPSHPDFNNGLWTDPFTDGLVAERTVTLSLGTQDVYLNFGWDEWDQNIVFYPIPENMHCRVGPDPICDPLKIPMEGTVLPILARDLQTEWKMTSYEGETCFVYLPAVQIDEALAKVAGNTWLTADLPIFEPQPPCPTPTPVPQPRQTNPTNPTGCSQYTDADSCRAAKCNWFKVNDSTSMCIPY